MLSNLRSFFFKDAPAEPLLDKPQQDPDADSSDSDADSSDSDSDSSDSDILMSDEQLVFDELVHEMDGISDIVAQYCAKVKERMDNATEDFELVLDFIKDMKKEFAVRFNVQYI